MRDMEERKEDLQEADMTEDTVDANVSEEETASETIAGDAQEDVTEAVDADAEDSAEDTTDEETQEAGEESKAEKKIFKKKAKADKKQDAMKEKIDELEDKVKRQMAEFDNFRKRTEKEKTMMFETGAKSVIEKILPVIDNFERGFAAVAADTKTPFEEGMEMVYKQLMAELEKMEVKPIPAVGEEFNPNFHNAVMQVESDEYEPGVVAQELMKGYTYRDTVVRYSMVAVVSE